jgi:ubiquinone biosynthesis protein
MAGAQLISRRTAPLAGQISIPGLLAAGVGVITWQRLIARRKPRNRLVTRVRKALDVARRGSATSTV